MPGGLGLSSVIVAISGVLEYHIHRYDSDEYAKKEARFSMRDGFVKVAAGTPEIRVADCRYNAEQIFTLMREADKQGVRVLALPELCLTGYTCGDLFLQDTLLKGAEEGLATILEATKNLDMLTALGLPVKNPWDGKLYNCAAVIHKGEILGLVPKTYVPNYGEFYEGRWFTSGKNLDVLLNLCGQQVSIWDREIWACDTMPDPCPTWWWGWRSVRICGPPRPPPWPWPRRGPP